MMEADKITIKDLGIFHNHEEDAIADILNLATTLRGKLQLKKNLETTYSQYEDIAGVQQAIASVALLLPHWPAQINNGTLMVVEKFFESQVESIPSAPGTISAASYKLFNFYDYSLIKYSVKHLHAFIAGLQKLIALAGEKEQPAQVRSIINEIKKLVDHKELLQIIRYADAERMPIAKKLRFASFAQRRYKPQFYSLIMLYARLDAWAGMAKAMQQFNLNFPAFTDGSMPYFEAEGLWHLLLREPVAYDINLSEHNNFLFLTGANMAGKSTFIKAVGSAVYLAHTGMGVPAKNMKLSAFYGLLSNINVIDNIAKGESYFFNEVQRIKATVTKVNDGRKWFILIDELFKGTNIQDAMKCSLAVIEGLLQKSNSVYILSTHLYEIGHELHLHQNINFKYFETGLSNNQLQFNYQLKPGISSDRLGYLILKQEGVLSMLGNTNHYDHQ